MSKIAIVTGASSGMGEQFVRKIFELNEVDEIWAIARRADRLRLLEEKYPSVKALPLDLTVTEQIDELVEKVKMSGNSVKYLVNAAGFGKWGDYSQVTRKDYLGMVDLNAKALLDITNQIIPFMEKGAHIIQMCSISSYLCLPHFSVYAATKAFVLSHSYALRDELKPRKISVTAVSPGWVETEFFNVADNGEVRMPKKFKPLLKPEAVVKKAIRDAKKNKPVSIKGLHWKMMHILGKIAPRTMAIVFWKTMLKK